MVVRLIFFEWSRMLANQELSYLVSVNNKNKNIDMDRSDKIKNKNIRVNTGWSPMWIR